MGVTVGSERIMGANCMRGCYCLPITIHTITIGILLRQPRETAAHGHPLYATLSYPPIPSTLFLSYSMTSTILISVFRFIQVVHYSAPPMSMTQVPPPVALDVPVFSRQLPLFAKNCNPDHYAAPPPPRPPLSQLLVFWFLFFFPFFSPHDKLNKALLQSIHMDIWSCQKCACNGTPPPNPPTKTD